MSTQAWMVSICELLRKISRFRGAARISTLGFSPLARSARPLWCLGARRLFLVCVIYSNLRDHDSYGDGSGNGGWWVGRRGIRVRARCRWNAYTVFPDLRIFPPLGHFSIHYPISLFCLKSMYTVI